MTSEKEVIWKTNLTPGMGYIHGPKGKKAYREALKHDKETLHRVVVNIVGKERQGKTSLRRMLVNEDFNENEQSTVGIEEDLVQTEGITPKTFWNKVDLNDANEQEFSVVLCKHIKSRLKRNKDKLKFYITPILLSSKILLVLLVTLMAYFSLSIYEVLRGYPWLTGLVLFTFVFSGLMFGLRDGFGLAVGMISFMIHCDAIHRWKLHETFDIITQRTCLTLSLLLCTLMYVVIQAVIGFCHGTSIGLGITLAFCLRSPPFRYQDEIFPLKNPHVLIMLTVSMVTVASLRYERVMFYIVGPMVAISICVLPREYSYTIMFAVGCGHTHTLFLGLGQKVYVYLNDIMKRYIESRFYRRYMCHIGGLIPGMLFTIFFEWTEAERRMLHVLSVIIFLSVIEGLNFAFGETKIIENPANVVNVAKICPSLKLIIRDFAGHPLYHCAHHVYMTGQNLYIVVFSSVEAKINFRECHQTVLYWLQSITIHDNYPRVRVFIVATRRDDDSLSTNDLKDISDGFKRNLPKSFYNAIVWNEHNSPIFFVENKVRDYKDFDHRKLRSKLSEIARQSETMKKKYPVKFFYFYNVIEQHRQRSQLIENVNTVFELCKNNTCAVETFQEFESMLQFYHQSGEIIFNSKDEQLRHQIIFDPRAFVGLLSHIITLPEFAERHQDFIGLYEHLAETGICSEQLLKHIVSQTQWEPKLSFATIVALLECFDLLFEIKFLTSSSSGHPMSQYVIPALIPAKLTNPDNYWETEITDFIFYVWFEPSLPNPLFLRLIAQCAVDRDSEPLVEYGLWFLNISQTSALLTSGGEFAYKIELVDRSVDHPNNIMRIVIRSRCEDGPLKLLNKIGAHMKYIANRHFAKCVFRITIDCPLTGPHDGPKTNQLHLLTLADMTQFENSSAKGIPQRKEFWCRGRSLKVYNGRLEHVSNSRGNKSPVESNDARHKRCDDLWNVSVKELPANIYSRVCDLLNIDNALHNDWRELAGKLGFTALELAIIKARRDKDPTDALLQDWASRDCDATVGKLICKLKEMERQDVYTLLEEYVT